MLRPGETVYDDSNYTSLLSQTYEQLPDGNVVGVHISGGQKRYLSRVNSPGQTVDYKATYSSPFDTSGPRGTNPTISRSDWKAALTEQTDRRRLVSQFQNFAPHDQDGLPTCWANGPAHAFTTARVMQGLPLVYMSACSVAVPISGGHSGGDEWDAAEYSVKYGFADFGVWGNNDTSYSLNTSQDVVESRKHHLALELYECNSFDEFATACLMGYCCAIAYNWWSHVIMLCDLVEVEAGSWGFRIRNNWGNWGDKNEYGQPGYAVFREGKGTPSSGFAYRQTLASAA